MTIEISRRRVIGQGLAMGAFLGIAGAPNSSAQTPADGEWTWTDDRGVTVTLPQRPTRIIAQSTVAVSLAGFGVPIAGHFGSEDPRQSVAFPEDNPIEISEWVFLGPWGEFDVEGALATGAELYVDLYRGEGADFWGLSDPATLDTVTATIPAIGINTFDATPDQTIARFAELAEALGIDLNNDTQSAARQAHAEAEAAFVATLEAKPGLTVLGVTGDPTTSAYVLNPELLGDLQYFASLGLDFVIPENPDPAQLNLFETLAWEELGRYPADIVIYDSRFEPPTGDPIWDALPAVRAGQVGSWYASLAYTWPELARYLESLTATVSAANVLE
jgi:iron complex transport system substrate-binding protein